MHTIEPFYSWLRLYDAVKDKRSPFYGLRQSRTTCRNTIYNYYIHPAWDEFGSSTLYLKLLYVSYDEGFAFIELMGEWNDVLHNDIMYLKRNIIDILIGQGVNKYVLVGDNILDFHRDTNDYYEEWYDETEDGWIVALNFREHVQIEFQRARLDRYMIFGGRFNEIPWRTQKPKTLFRMLDDMIMKRLNP